MASPRNLFHKQICISWVHFVFLNILCIPGTKFLLCCLLENLTSTERCSTHQGVREFITYGKISSFSKPFWTKFFVTLVITLSTITSYYGHYCWFCTKWDCEQSVTTRAEVYVKKCSGRPLYCNRSVTTTDVMTKDILLKCTTVSRVCSGTVVACS